MAEVSIHHIRMWRDKLAKEAQADGAAMFMGKPDAWFEDLHWFCPNGHVSGSYLSSEVRGDLCLACNEPVLMGPPIGEKAFKPILENLTRIRLFLRSSKTHQTPLP
jgi:hypothetical protein